MQPPFRPIPEPGEPPYLIAHRGVSAKAPENTLAAFRLALQTPGIDMIELDVRLSKENEVIVLHDRTLQRTTTGNGPARSYALHELKQYDAGSWFHPRFSSERIPTLREVFDLVRGRCWIDVEIKSDYWHREPEGLLERRVLETVAEAGFSDRVMYSSFDHQLIGRLKRIAPNAVTGVIYRVFRDFGRLPSKLTGRVGASVFVCGKHELTRAMVQDARRHNIPLYVYTLNSVADVRSITALGVQGIISDAADDLVTVVKRKE
jgi:glycerophosphoryl diester phosphodiesterase